MTREQAFLKETLCSFSKLFGVQASRAPSQWNNRVRTALKDSGKIQSENGELRKHLNHTANLQVGHTNDETGYIANHTWATLEALYAYAMWVDTDFYMTVVAAFTELTKGNTLQPQQTIKLTLQL